MDLMIWMEESARLPTKEPLAGGGFKHAAGMCFRRARACALAAISPLGHVTLYIIPELLVVR